MPIRADMWTVCGCGQTNPHGVENPSMTSDFPQTYLLAAVDLNETLQITNSHPYLLCMLYVLYTQ